MTVKRSEFLRLGAGLGLAAMATTIPAMAEEAQADSVDQSSDPLLIQYWQESFSSYVLQGGATATAIGGLQVQLTAATIYQAGVRTTLAAVTVIVSATSDTYIDAAQDGLFHLSPVANGATPPPLYPNSVRVAKVSTSATSVTALADLRVYFPVSTLAANSATTLVTLQQTGYGHSLDIPVSSNGTTGVYFLRSGTSSAIVIDDHTSDPTGLHDLIDIYNRNGGDAIFVDNHGTGGAFKCFVGDQPGDPAGIGFQTQVWHGQGLIVQNQGDPSTTTIFLADNVAANVDFLQVQVAAGNVGRAIDVYNYGVGTGIFVSQVGNGRAMQLQQAGGDNALTIVKTSTPGNAVLISDYSSGPSVWVQKQTSGIAAMITKYNTGPGDCLVIYNYGTGNDVTGTSGSWSITKAGYANFSQSGVRNKYVTQTPVLSSNGDHQVYWDGSQAWAYWMLNGTKYRVQLQPSPN